MGGPCDVVEKLEPELTFTAGSGDRLQRMLSASEGTIPIHVHFGGT